VALILADQLDWSSAPSSLEAFAKGELSLHSAGSAIQEVDGFLTVGKGRRAQGLGPLTTVTRATNISPTYKIPDWKRIVSHDAAHHYGGKLGAFGTALQRSGRTWRFITQDPDSVLAIADETGTVRHASWGNASNVHAAVLSGVDIVIANASSPADVPGLVQAAAGRCTLVASVSSPLGFTHLGVFAASPECGLGQGGLFSFSTRQPPFLALIDVAPTLFDRAGLAPQHTMIGQPARRSGSVTMEQLAAEDLRAHRTLAAHDDFAWFFVGATSIAAALMFLLRRLPLVVMAAVAALPVSSFLIMTVHWWSRGSLFGLLTCALMAAAIGSAAALALRNRPTRCFAAIAAFTVAVLIGDGVLGGTLELDAPFGNSPTIAGRFDGIGNVAFGFSMGAALVACALALHYWKRRALPWVVIACAGFALAGAPALGDKVGLVPVWIPAAGVLIASSGAGRIRLKWVLILAGIVLVVLGCFAVYDLTRESTTQSHLGRWLSSGDTLDTVRRKATSMVQSFKSEPTRFLLPLPLLVFLRDWRILTSTVWLRSLCLALATAMILGSLLEDSGIAVGAAVLTASWPAVAWFADSERRAAMGHQPGPSSGDPVSLQG